MKSFNRRFIKNFGFSFTVSTVLNLYFAFYACFIPFITGILITDVSSGLAINDSLCLFAVITFVFIILKVIQKIYFEKKKTNVLIELSDYFTINSWRLLNINKKITPGDLNQIFNTKIRYICALFYDYYPDMQLCIITMIISTIRLFMKSWIIGLILLFVGTGLYFFFNYLRKKISTAYTNKWYVDKDNQKTASLIESNFSYLNRSSNFNFMKDLINDKTSNQYKSNLKIAVIMGLGFGSAMVIVYLTQALPLLYILLSKANYNMGTVFEIIGLAGIAVGTYTTLGQKISSCQQARIAKNELESYFKKLDVQKENFLISNNECVALLKNICFSYNQDEILNDFSYDFKKNNFYLITGENGKGKTSLLKLISGILVPDAGCITTCDKERIYFSQEKNIIYNMSLYENIVSSTDSDSRVYLESRVKEIGLEKNLDDIVKENSLSGGEIDKIKYLRLMTLKDIDLLLLDEPFNNVDSSHKKDFYADIIKKFSNSTLILIDHLFDVSEFKEFEIQTIEL